jgi:hypothetical protein
VHWYVTSTLASGRFVSSGMIREYGAARIQVSCRIALVPALTASNPSRGQVRVQVDQSHLSIESCSPVLLAALASSVGPLPPRSDRRGRGPRRPGNLSWSWHARLSSAPQSRTPTMIAKGSARLVMVIAVFWRREQCLMRG